jgi:hypothetical protein
MSGKAKIEIYVSYAGEEYCEEGECDPEYFYDDLGDIVAVLDCILREKSRARKELILRLKA